MSDAPERIAIVSLEPMGDMTGPAFDASVAVGENACGHPYVHADRYDAALEGIRTKNDLLKNVQATLVGALDALSFIEEAEGPDLSKDKVPIKDAIEKIDRELFVGFDVPAIVLPGPFGG